MLKGVDCGNFLDYLEDVVQCANNTCKKFYICKMCIGIAVYSI